MSKEGPLDVKIEKAIRKSSPSKKSTFDLINNFLSNRDLNIFFNHLSTNQHYKQLLFLHRYDLFDLEDEMLPLYFHLCSLSMGESELATQIEDPTLEYVISKESEAISNGMVFLQNLLALDEGQWDIFLEDIMDVVAYLSIYFIRYNQNIKNLVNAEIFDYETMKAVLKSYENTINFSSFIEETVSALETDQDVIDPIIKEKIFKLLTQVFSGFRKNLNLLIEDTDKFLPNFKLTYHLSSSILIKKLLSLSGLSFNEYTKFLDELYRNRLIENKSTIFWCENCSLENPSYSEHHGRIAPSKISRNNCLYCNQPQSYASIFSIDTTLKEAILSKDGLLSVYLGWLLKKEGIKFEVGGYTAKFENDFVIDNSILVECKMFKSNKDRVAIRSNLDSCFSQIKKHIKQLEKEGTKIQRAYLVWNRRETEKEIQNKLESKYMELFRKYSLKIICPDKIEELVEVIKSYDR